MPEQRLFGRLQPQRGCRLHIASTLADQPDTESRPPSYAKPAAATPASLPPARTLPGQETPFRTFGRPRRPPQPRPLALPAQPEPDQEHGLGDPPHELLPRGPICARASAVFLRVTLCRCPAPCLKRLSTCLLQLPQSHLLLRRGARKETWHPGRSVTLSLSPFPDTGQRTGVDRRTEG